MSTFAPARAPRSRGIEGHQAAIGKVSVAERHGLPVTDAATTFCQLGAVLSLDDLVAVGDSLILDPAVLDPRDIRPYVTVEELAERVAGFRGRGARAAASALLLLRQGAESRPETLLRLVLWRAGLPKPEVNPDLRDTAGRWLGRADLVYRQWRVIVKYDGDQHRTDTRQYEKDITRIDDFMTAKWTVVRVRKRGLFGTPDVTVARVLRALRDGGWRSE